MLAFAVFPLRRIALGLLLAGSASVVGCGHTDSCEDPDPTVHTAHVVISEARAAALVATADGGYGASRCNDDCGPRPHPYSLVGSCTVGAPVDGGVALSCVFFNGCR